MLAQEPSEARYVPIYQQQTYGTTLPTAPSLVEPGGYTSFISTPVVETSSSWFPAIESLLKVGGSIAGQFFQLQAMKEQAKAATKLASAQAATTRAGMPLMLPSPTSQIAGIPLTTLLLIGAVGVGAVILLRRK